MMRHIVKWHLALATACVALCATAANLTAQSSPELRYVDLATPFERVAIDTAGQPENDRIGVIRSRVGGMVPGIYPGGTAMDRRIVVALQEFPADRAGYDRVIASFPAALRDAIKRFRKVFPDFASPLPIYLYHSLGQRDGGSDYLQPGNRHVMLFGADMIAKYHDDESLEPFLIHEIFHLEHARHFADCDQLWCTLWQEGLAVDATATMVPHATDHQLLLDIPRPIRAPTEAQWPVALCFVADHFDDTGATAGALMMGGDPPKGLPDRFGYYVGFRLAQATGSPIIRLSRLRNEQVRAIARDALAKLIREAGAPCAAPPGPSPTR